MIGRRRVLEIYLKSGQTITLKGFETYSFKPGQHFNWKMKGRRLLKYVAVDEIVGLVEK